ncbi:MAG TPA: hypothetical protein VIU86_04750 [Gaiellaceae bacterium]|jgi:hypothetical protein
MHDSRFELRIGDRGVACPRQERLVDVEECWRCPALLRRKRGAIVCKTATPRLSALDLPA